MSKMPKPLRYCLLLVVLGLITGCILAFVNDITKGPIKMAAEKKVLDVIESSFDGYEFLKVTDKIEVTDKEVRNIFFGYQDSELKIVVYQVSTKGYSSGEIVTLVGIDYINDKFIKVSVVSASGQTAGVGDKILTHDFKVSNQNTSSYNVEVISGATFSSSAVINAIDIAASNYRNHKTEYSMVK